MKNKFLAMAALTIGCTATAAAQNTATTSADAFATIVTPIGITKGADLNFGKIVRAGTPGTVTVATDGSATTTVVTQFVGSNNTTPAAATFTISGESGYTYAITLPADNAVVLKAGVDDTMELTSFTKSAVGTFSATSETISVGATLQVKANQAAGAYTGTFDVTVAYN